MTRTNVAVFASGSGSNFEAIAQAAHDGELAIDIQLLIVDKEDAYAIERAKKWGIPTKVYVPKMYESKEAYERDVLQQLNAHHVELVILAGYMRLVGKTLLDAYEGRMINIHPSLLPSFPGKDAIGQAVRHGVKVTGVTVHYVDSGMDTGPIIAQRATDVVPNDIEATTKNVQAVEHELYKEAIQQILMNK